MINFLRLKVYYTYCRPELRARIAYTRAPTPDNQIFLFSARLAPANTPSPR